MIFEQSLRFGFADSPKATAPTGVHPPYLSDTRLGSWCAVLSGDDVDAILGVFAPMIVISSVVSIIFDVSCAHWTARL